MSIIHSVLARVKGRANTGVTMPVMDAVTIMSKTSTSSSAWAEVTGFVPPDLDCFCEITVLSGGACRVFFGESAPSGNDVGHAIPEGVCKPFSPNSTSGKLFIKDA